MIRNIILVGSLLALPSPTWATEVSRSASSPQEQHTRVLAASCAACHGTNGNSQDITPTLAGLDAGYFITQMLAFKNGGRSSTVMHHHAKGLSADEINELAVYFSQQDRATPKPLKSQTWKASHE